MHLHHLVLLDTELEVECNSASAMLEGKTVHHAVYNKPFGIYY
jgi:hypothetical protein